MSGRLDGKVALVFGGRGYLGRGFCTALQAAGARVAAADAADAATATDDVRQLLVDVTDEKSVAGAVADVLSAFGRVDVMVYAVTTKPADFYKPLEDSSLDGWRSILSAELDGLFLACRETGRAMRDRGGSMVLLSSIYGVVANDQRLYEGSNLAQVYGSGDAPERIYSHAGYATAKGGVISLTRFLAAYWGRAGIRVNCISAGGVAHPGENDAFVRKYSDRVPLGRKARAAEVAEAVLFLASDVSSYVTGHNLVVDGGWTIW